MQADLLAVRKVRGVEATTESRLLRKSMIYWKNFSSVVDRTSRSLRDMYNIRGSDNRLMTFCFNKQYEAYYCTGVPVIDTIEHVMLNCLEDIKERNESHPNDKQHLEHLERLKRLVKKVREHYGFFSPLDSSYARWNDRVHSHLLDRLRRRREVEVA